MRDFERPLEELPAIRELTFDEFTLGSTEVSLYRPQDKIVINGEPITYEMTLRGQARKRYEFSWSIESRLLQIDRKGNEVRLAKKLVQSISASRLEVSTNIGFETSPEPGLYRYDIRFKRKNKVLRRYQSYFRVVPVSRDVRLRLNGRIFRAEDLILGKIENYTPEPVAVEEDYWIQQYDGTSWNLINLDDLLGHDVVFSLGLFGVRAGSSGRCSAWLKVPQSMSPGRYRMVKPLNKRSRHYNKNERHFAVAEFIVTSP